MSISEAIETRFNFCDPKIRCFHRTSNSVVTLQKKLPSGARPRVMVSWCCPIPEIRYCGMIGVKFDISVVWGKHVGILVHLQVIQPRGSFLHTLVLFAYLLINCNEGITAISISTRVKYYKSCSDPR